MNAPREVRDQIALLMRRVADHEAALDERGRDADKSGDRLMAYLFEITDSLDRLIESDSPPSMDAIQAVRRQVVEFLGVEHVRPFKPAIGDRPDPASVEVIATVEAGSTEPGRVTRVFHDGYVRGDRVLRRAGIEMSRG